MIAPQIGYDVPLSIILYMCAGLDYVGNHLHALLLIQGYRVQQGLCFYPAELQISSPGICRTDLLGAAIVHIENKFVHSLAYSDTTMTMYCPHLVVENTL